MLLRLLSVDFNFPKKMILIALSSIGAGCGSSKHLKDKSEESDQALITRSTPELNITGGTSGGQGSSKEQRGTIRLVNPNQWACLAWTVADVTMPNSVIDNVLKKEPQVLSGSHLISMKSSDFFVDYSQDPATRGLGYNGAWGDCPLFVAIVRKQNSYEVELQTNTVYTASAFDGNGNKMIPHHTKNPYCVTDQDGSVVMAPCNADDLNQRWLWDMGKNNGYGYIKSTKNEKRCLDVAGGGAGVGAGRPLILHGCKSFVAGPEGMSNNQRFSLDQSGAE